MILIRVLLGSSIFVNMPYSLYYVCSIFSGLRIYVANPPRVHPGRLDSTRVNPSIVGGAVPSATHVSYRHNISKFSCSNISNSFI